MQTMTKQANSYLFSLSFSALKLSIVSRPSSVNVNRTQGFLLGTQCTSIWYDLEGHKFITLDYCAVPSLK